MAAYFALRIEKGKLSYSAVIKRYGMYKDDIDFILASDGYIIVDDTAVKIEA